MPGRGFLGLGFRVREARRVLGFRLGGSGFRVSALALGLTWARFPGFPGFRVQEAGAWGLGFR